MDPGVQLNTRTYAYHAGALVQSWHQRQVKTERNTGHDTGTNFSLSENVKTRRDP